MDGKNKELELLERALERFRKMTMLTVERLGLLLTPYGPDATIRIARQDKVWLFDVEVINWLTRPMIGGAVERIRRFQQKVLLVTRHVTPQIADLLKERNIPFIDTAGNAYINEPDLFIYITGNKPDDKHIAEPLKQKFRPTGLQVIFALLCNPGLENAPFRDIARAANVALGTVGWVVRELKIMDYLIDMGKRGRRLTRKERLLERWIAMYPERLRPKQFIGHYKAVDLEWWKHADLDHLDAYWGGEIAAAKLTKYLRPQIATIYANQNLGELFLKHQIRNDPNGGIEILKKFWGFEHKWPHPNLVHPLLIYTDLLATGDARNIETAGIIYEKEIAQLIREN